MRNGVRLSDARGELALQFFAAIITIFSPRIKSALFQAAGRHQTAEARHPSRSVVDQDVQHGGIAVSVGAVRRWAGDPLPGLYQLAQHV